MAASRHERSERLLGIALLMPAGLLLGLVVLYPVFDLLKTSFYELKLSDGPGIPHFIGLANYAKALADPGFWHAASNTLWLTIVTVPGALIFGLALAMLANQIVARKWIVRLALLMPWMLPLVFTGLLFHWFFDFRFGIVNDVILRAGATPPQWLSSPGLAFAAICIAIVWKTSSFVALVLLAGLQTIPKELYEAADMDGATPAQQFARITIPMLRPSIVVALVFRTITSIQTFDIPYAMTGGGPGDATETLAMYIQKTTIDFLDFGYGSALAALMFIVSMLATGTYLKYIRRREDEA